MLRIIFPRGVQTVTVVDIELPQTNKACRLVNTTKLTNKSITQVSGANPDSHRKKGGVVFTIRHQKIQIKAVDYMKGSAEWSQGIEKLMTRTSG